MSELYSRAEALERLGGDMELFKNLTRLFIEESAAYCSALEHALAGSDMAALQREAHSVKSMLATFSFEKGRELAMRLEHLAAAGNPDGVASLTAEVVAAIRQLAEALSGETA